MSWHELLNPLTVGPWLLVASAARALLVRRRRARRIQVTGRIVAWQGTDVLSPTIAFTTLDGREVVAPCPGIPDPLEHSLHSVPVWYDADDPESFSTQLGRRQAPGMVLALLALPWLLFDLVILLAD